MAIPLPRIPQPAKIVIPTNIIRQGKSAYLSDRGQRLAQMGAELGTQFGEQEIREEIEEDVGQRDGWQNLSDEMRRVKQRSEMGMGEKLMDKLGPLLAPLEPLKYLDIPIELAAEAVIDPLEMALPGKQFNWLRGSAERDNFEGWKSIIAGMKGEKKLFDVMDDIAHAFEKRPFLAQVGLGFAYAMPVSRIGSISKLGKLAKPTMYTLDPVQLPFDYVLAPAVRKAWRHFKPPTTPVLSALPTDPERLNVIYGDSAPQLYTENVAKTERHRTTNEPLNPTAFHDPYVVQKKTTIHRQSNALTRLRGFLNQTADIDTLDERTIPGISNARGVSEVVRSRDKALLDIQQATFARPGQLQRMSVSDLEHFIEFGEVRLRSSVSKVEREGFHSIADDTARESARISAAQYLGELKRTKANIGIKKYKGEVLYDLLAGTDEGVFRAVHVKLDENLMPIGEKFGIHATGGESATNILSGRLQFYNKHYGSAIADDINGVPVNQPLPLNDQTLRHIAATKLAAQPGARPIDIQMALLHVKDSDQYLTYIEDIEAINTVDDFQFYFGDLQLGTDVADYRRLVYEADPKSVERIVESEDLIGGYANKLGIRLRPIQVTKGEISGANEIVHFTDNLVEKMKGWGMDVEDGRAKVRAYVLERSKMTGTMGRKSLKEGGAFDTKSHKDYVDFIGDLRFNALKQGEDAIDLDPEIMQLIQERIGKESLDNPVDEDILRGIAAVSVMKQESVELLHSFQRLQFRQDVIRTNLERQGYIKRVNNQWRWMKRSQGEIAETKADIIKRFGEGAWIEEADAIRLWGPVGTKEGAITQWLDASNTSPVDYVNSYHGIARYTRRQANQLHMHEIMIAAAKNKQKKLMIDISDRRYDIIDAVDDVAQDISIAGSPMFHSNWTDILQDGWVDEDFLAMEDIMRNRVEAHDPTWLEAVTLVSEGDGKLPGQRSTFEIRNTARKPLLEVINSVEDLVGLNRLDLNVEADLETAVEAVKSWLGIVPEGTIVDADVAQGRRYVLAALEQKGLKIGVSSKTIKRALQRAYNEIPQLFGKDVVGETKRTTTDIGPWGTIPDNAKVPIEGLDYKIPGLQWETVGYEAQIAKRIDDVARILATPEGRKIMQMAGIGGEVRTVVPLDFRVPDVWSQRHLEYLRRYAETRGVTVGGQVLTSDGATGIIPDLVHLTGQIKTKVGKHRQQLLGQNARGEPLKNRNGWQKFAAGLTTAMAGGMNASGMTKIARLYVGRRKGHKLADMAGRECAWQATQVLEGPESVLKMVTDDPTEAQKIAQQKDLSGTATFLDAGLARGHQYFSGLTAKQIEFNPAQTAITGKYVDGTLMSENVRELVQEALDVVRLNDVDNFMIPAQIADGTASNSDNVYKLLTQVDAALEMLGPDEWVELFNVTDTQMSHMSFLRNITAKMDEKAAQKGYYIKKEIENAAKASGRKTPTYKEGGYIPRLARQTAHQIAKSKDNIDGVINNMEWWLEARVDDSVFYSMQREGHTYDDLSYRLGQYVESMNKAMVDTQLGNALQRIYAPTKASLTAAQYNRRKLKALTKVVHGIEGGDISPTIDNLGDFDEIATADWSYVGEELHDMVAQLIKAEDFNARKTVLEGFEPGTLEELILQESKKSQDLISSLSTGKKFFGDELYKGQKRWMQGLRFTPDEWNSLDQQLRVARTSWRNPAVAPAKWVRGTARMIRTLKAGFDLGVLMIHGYTALVSAPSNILLREAGVGWQWNRQRAWGKAAKEMFKFAWTPEHYDTYMGQAESMALRRRISPYVILGHAEPLAATANSQTFAKVRAQLARVPGVSKAKAAHRSEAAFVGTLDVLRMELWEGMIKTVERDYKRLVEADGFPAWTNDFTKASKQQRDALTDFGATVNKMTGVYDSDLSGLTPTQGLIENSFIFFAPMYRRATYGIIADIARGGMRRDEALRSVGGVLSAGVLLAGASEYLLGNEGAADPTSANFMKIVVGDQKVGISGAWNTLLKLGVDMHVASMAMFGSARPDDVFELINDNPIISQLGRRGRSHMAPPAQILCDVIDGKTYMGDPLRDIDGDYDWSEMGAYAGQQFQPFWGDPILTGGKLGAVGGLFEACGLQSWRVSDFDDVQRTRQYAIENETGIDLLNTWRAGKLANGEKLIWSEVPEAVKLELETNNIELIESMDKWKTKWGEVSRGDDRQWYTFRMRSSDIDLNSAVEVARITTKFEKGEITGRKLNQEIRQILVYKGIAKRSLLQDPDLSHVAQELNEYNLAGADKKSTAFIGDIIFDLYQTDVVHNPNNFDADENFIWDNRLANETRFKNAHNLANRPELWNYIKKRERQWFQDNPVMVEFDISKDTLQQYWNIHKDPNIFPSIEDRVKAKEYIAAPSAHRKAMLIDADPDMARIERTIERARLAMRKEIPAVDWALVKFHGARPISGETAQRENLWMQAQQNSLYTNAVLTPSPSGYKKTAAGRIIHSSLTGV